MNPAQLAIASYLGIPLTSEARALRYRKGLNVIIIGPPLSGKSYQAKVAISTLYILYLDVLYFNL